MKPSTLLLPTLLTLPSHVLSCDPSALANQGTNATLPFTFTPGDDPPADAATLGHFVNHIGLQVSDLAASRKWYAEVLGMRHIFTVDLSADFSIMYMGHAQGGRNGTGFQTGAEMARDKNNMAGLVELQVNKKSANRTHPSLSPRNTFSHLGLIVPDINAAQSRFEAQGVRIIKRVGEMDVSGDTEESRILGGAWGFPDVKGMQAEIRAVVPGLEAIGFVGFCVIADPDGNLFEVQGEVGAL